MTFIEQEVIRNTRLIEEGIIFEWSKLSEKSNKILADNQKNLYWEIRNDVQAYFLSNNIDWWSGELPGNYLSSQIACLNHLFLIRYDKQAVLSVIKNIDCNFDDVYIIPEDNGFDAYISFEVVSNKQHLNEGSLSRGKNCTSIDALIYAHRKDGKKVIIPIEWKFTENYHDEDKTNLKRLNRYSELIDASNELVALKNYEHSVYFVEPFYQLMRQVLWSEQLILHKEEELVQADDYLHLHVIASGNTQLKNKKYKISNENLFNTWKKQLKNPNKYVIISPEDLIYPIVEKYEKLSNYLAKRYW